MIRKTLSNTRRAIGRRVIGTAALATLMLAGWARADVMEQVPSNSLMVFKVTKMNDMSTKLGKLMTDWGVTNVQPDAGDPLATFKKEMKISAGLKEDGDAAFAFISPKATNVKDGKSMIVVLPVSDYKAFIGNFEGATTEGDITTVKIGNEEKDSFVTDSYIVNRDGYAVISPVKELVEKKFDAVLKLEGATLKEVQRHDAVLYANIPAIKEEVNDDFAKGREKALAEIEQNLSAEGNEAYVPLAKAAMTQVFAVGEAYLRDSKSATLGVTMGEKGINFTMLTDFKPDSYCGQLAAGMKSTDAPLLKGLPDHRYIYYAGSKYDPAVISKALNDLSKPIMDELAKVDNADLKEVTKLADQMKLAVAKFKGGTVGMVFPEDISRDALISQIAVYDGGGQESSDFLDSVGKFLPDAVKHMAEKQAKEAGAANADPQMKINFNDKFKTIDGINFHNVGFVMPMPQNNPMLPQLMKVMYGQDGPGMTYGVTGDKLVYYSGLSDETVTKFITATKNGDEGQAKKELVQSVASQLPKERWMELYFHPDEMINMMVTGVNQFMPGMVNMELPADLAPIGMTVGGEGSTMRMDVYVPTNTVSQIVSAIIQQVNNMKTGRRGGGAL